MSTTWPAPELDGWTYAHNTIRLDEADLLATVARLNEKAQACEHVEDWEIEALKTHWKMCYGFIEEHHHNEEAFIFPMIETKVSLPDKMSDDHEVIENQVQLIDGLVKSLNPDRISDAAKAATKDFMLSPTSINVHSTLKVNVRLAETLSKLYEAIATMQESMDPHLAEEEAMALPAMHSNFTPAEVKPIMDKMVAAMEWWALPHFYRQHKVINPATGAKDWDRAAIREHATATLGMPGFVFDFIIFPTFKKYDLEYGWAIEESKDPSQRAHFEARRRSASTWFRATRKALARVSGRRGVLSGKNIDAAAQFDPKPALAPQNSATLLGH